MKWISSRGGPFICTDKKTAEGWQGLDGVSVKPVVNFDSDYVLACQTNDYAELLGGIISNVLVINDLPNDITWLSLGAGDGIFIKWIGADSEEQVMSSIDKVMAQVFTDLAINFVVNGGRLIAFDSACKLGELENNYIEFDMPIGTYSVSFANYMPDDSLSLNIIRLRLAS